MSWSIGYDSAWKRDIGYGVPATCDHPGCGAKIDRGLGHVCGGEPYGGDKGCGLYFCSAHLAGTRQRCGKCRKYRQPYEPTPDVAEWVNHKATDPSWAQWREKEKA